MVQYRRALNSSGEVVTAESLAGTVISDSYSCISCDKTLVAKVNGSEHRPHFAHKAKIECCGETYLHRLTKRVFRETYTHCLETGVPFLISFNTPRVCDKNLSLLNRICVLGEETQEYDLTQYYTEIREETRDGEFVPDISLHSKTRPDDVIYIEVAVTHFLSEKKSMSARRIIEIPIRSEDGVNVLRSAKLTPEIASFKGFEPKVHAIPDAECRCANDMVFAFYVFDSGGAYLSHAPLKVVQSKIQGRRVKYVNLIPDRDHDFGVGTFDPDRGSLFIEQVKLAQQRGVPIKNCYLCQHGGDNWDASSEEKIFCKSVRVSCGSNEATRCGEYRVREEFV